MHSVINVDEKIGKIVGRRGAPRDPFAYGMALQQTAIDLGKSFGHGVCPKGVYRFRSHEEADAWMREMMIRSQKTRR